MNTSIKAMIFAAGLGTRLYPLTKDKPKALVAIDGKTLLERAIDKLTAAGIDDIVINVHHFSEQIKSFVENHSFEANISISDESRLLLDTAGGLKFAEPFFANTQHILLYNVDILSSINLSKLIQYHIDCKAIATLAVKNRSTFRRFIFDNDTMQLCGWQNEKTGEKKLPRTTSRELPLAFSGIHIVNNEILNYIPRNEKLSMTPLYLDLANNQIIKGYRHDEDSWMDIGKYEEFVNLDLKKLSL